MSLKIFVLLALSAVVAGQIIDDTDLIFTKRYDEGKAAIFLTKLERELKAAGVEARTVVSVLAVFKKYGAIYKANAALTLAEFKAKYGALLNQDLRAIKNLLPSDAAKVKKIAEKLISEATASKKYTWGWWKLVF
ncbi:unnamed protein product [Caenorhabditis auriculariae]|uniref:SXP/RAL-2 family protein Ani s 5-like cation-binding domain-containing protein n=1 Tax=Caenorhabditis auriculariae TaxID=2777116 RepID=A0A8S1HIT5_9PELO|nr:unnamed protein product [Caenorhabditis auriculariae]